MQEKFMQTDIIIIPETHIPHEVGKCPFPGWVFVHSRRTGDNGKGLASGGIGILVREEKKIAWNGTM